MLGGPLTCQRLPPFAGVALIWDAVPAGTVVRRASRGDCPVGTDTAGYRTMVKQVRDQWPQHRKAVDVPAKLAARVRVR